jgi:hypothetical protein
MSGIPICEMRVYDIAALRRSFTIANTCQVVAFQSMSVADNGCVPQRGIARVGAKARS